MVVARAEDIDCRHGRQLRDGPAQQVLGHFQLVDILVAGQRGQAATEQIPPDLNNQRMVCKRIIDQISERRCHRHIAVSLITRIWTSECLVLKLYRDTH